MKISPSALILTFLLLVAGQARATELVQEFFIPLPEDQVQLSLKALYSKTGNQIETVTAIVSSSDGTIIHYDEWEDGYEFDLDNPVQASTRIWGDGNPANGTAPGHADDLLNKGAVIVLKNTVDLPRNPSTYKYDGRDRFGANVAVAANRAEYAVSPGTVLAGASEILSLLDYGTEYEIPVGQNLASVDNGMFEYVGLFVQAAEDDTACTLEPVPAGSIALPILSAGASYHKNGGVKAGDKVTCNRPVQVHLITGDIGANYESRWYLVPPTSSWSSEYYSPVGTAADGDATFIFVYNPQAFAITVNYETLTGTGNFDVDPGGVYRFQMPASSGAHFYNPAGTTFYAMATVGANPTANNVHDWGFPLIPKGALTPQAIAAWAPDSENVGTSQGKGSPLWVTVERDTTVYVDYRGDGGSNSAPNGIAYDQAFAVGKFQSQIIPAPASTNYDNTGTRLFTADGTLLTAAWGQNPATAGAGTPYLDLGTTVMPFPVPKIVKMAKLCDPDDVEPNPGDTLCYTITIENKGLIALTSRQVVDDFGDGKLDYVPGSTKRDDSQIPDGTGGTFPLSGSGYLIDNIPARDSTVITYQATIKAGASGTLTNAVTLGNDIRGRHSFEIIPAVPSTCSLSFTDSGGGATKPPYAEGGTLYIKLVNTDLTGTSVSVLVKNPADGGKDTESVTLTGSGGTFIGSLPSSPTAGQTTSDGTLYYQQGDTAQVSAPGVLGCTTQTDTASIPVPSETKTLYLSHDGADNDATGDLDRIDPTSATTPLRTTAAIAPGAALSITDDFGSGTASYTGTGTGWSGGWTETDISGTSQSPTSGEVQLTTVAGAGGSGFGVDFGAASDTGSATLRLERTFSSALSSDATLSFKYRNQGMGTGTGQKDTLLVEGWRNSAWYTIGKIEGKVTDGGSTGMDASFTTYPTASSTVVVTKTSDVLAGTSKIRFTHDTNRVSSDDIYIDDLSISTTAPATTASFAQAIPLAAPLALVGGAAVSVTAYVSAVTGIPTGATVTAILSYGTTTIATLGNPVYDAGAGTLTWTGTLASAVDIPADSTIKLAVANGAAGSSFKIDYDDASKRSRIDLPTSTVIKVDSFGLYDAPWPGGSLVTSANNGQTLYARALVSDPFGAYDITGLDLAIDGPDLTCDLSPTLFDANVVSPNPIVGNELSKTYQYVWNTGACEGVYNLAATAKEGTEGTITDTAATQVDLSATDTGTPGIVEFIDSSDADKTSYTTAEQVCLRVTDLDQAGRAESIVVKVTGSLSGAQSGLTLAETPANSGIFIGCFSNPSTPVFQDGDVLTATYTDPNDTTDVANDLAVVTNEGTPPSLLLSKARVEPDDGNAEVGEPVVYEISATNSGLTALETVKLVDTFSSTCYSFQSATPAPNASAVGSLIWNNVGPIAVGASVKVRVTLTAAAACDTTPATNTVNAFDASNNALAGPATATVEIVPTADLAVTKSNALDSVSSGGTTTYTITVANNGPSAADDATVQDPAVTGLTKTGTPTCTASGGAVCPGSLTTDALESGVSIPTLPSGGSLTFTLQAQVTATTGSVTNGVSVSPPSGVTDPASANDNAYDIDQVKLTANLAITKTNNATSLAAGGTTTYTITVTNNGPSAVTGASIQDSAPAGLVFGDWTCTVTNAGTGVGEDTACGAASGTGDLETTATLKNGAVLTYSVRAKVASNASGSLANTATVQPPSGTTDPTPGNNSATDTDPVNTGAIGDYVWYDTNQNGIQDPAESGIAGVEVILYDSTGANKLAETLTDGSGKYRFNGLADGIYVVQFQPAAAYMRTTTNAGSGDLQDSFDSDATNGEYKVTVTLTGGATDVTIDAGFYIEDTSPASIGDYVWYDTDKDGIQDAGEPGLGGIAVSLLDADNSNALVATRVSDADGSYEFAGLPAGNYVLQFDAPDGYVLSPQDAGSPNDDATDSDADPSTGLTASIPLTAGQSLTDVDAGLSLTSGNPGSIGDRVWYDGGSGNPAHDGNGIQDADEPGIPGVRVNLYDATGTTLLQTTLTDPEGAYRFSGLPEGDYVVEVMKPNANYVFSPTGEGTSATDSDPDPTTGRVTVTLADGQANNAIDAGLRVDGQSPITIGDFVWKDADDGKDPDSGEGLANVEVVLYDNLGFPLVRLTTTAADANYGFTGVAAGGSYRVAIDTGTLGNLIQIADPDDVLDNRTDLIDQTASTTTADFGYLAPTPSVTIVKTAADGDPRKDSQQIRSGGTANFEVTVTNNGNLTLTNIAVTDALTPACNFTIDSLAPGASSTVKTCSETNVTADFTNTANVEAQPVDASGNAFGDTVTDSDTTAVDVVHPAITISKTPDTQTVTSGGTASFTIRVTNTGDVTLTNVAVTDSLTTACAKTKTDIAGLGSLASAAYVEYSCESSALTASFVNTASVTATPPVGAAVTANDSAAVNVVTPGISITKTPEEQTIHKGGTAEFTITVTNTGDVALTGVTVDDPNSSDCDKEIGTLAAGESDSYTCSQTNVEASFDNTATVTADGGLSADDVAAVTVIDPQLSLTKLTNDANDADGAITVRTGTLVTWEYIVENTGDVALTNVTVVDAPEGTISCPPDEAAELAVGASMTCLGYGLAGGADYDNTATATGTPPSGPDVEASDASAYTGYNPGVIGNRVWLDENGNGIPDAGEPGIANLKVELKDGDTVVATTYTDTNGGYLFTGVPAGEYQVVVTPTSGLQPTYNEDFAAEPSAGALDNQTAVTLAAGVQHLTADFGYNWVAPAVSTNPDANTTGAIGDRVWNDANEDGLQNPGESGIGGVTLTLTGPGDDRILGTADDATLATTQTDAAGNYIFDDLPSGAYAITVDTTTLPTGSGLSWTQTGDPDGAGSTDGKTTTPILLAPGDVYVNADFGYQPNQGSSIGDLVWFDMNANGQLDAGETGVPGIGIALVRDTNGNDVWDAGEPVIATTVTDASGNYLFPGVQAGDYVVAVTDAESLLYWALSSSDPDLPGVLNNGLEPDARFDQRAAVSVDGTTDELGMDFGYMAYGMHAYTDIPGLIGSSGLVGDLVYLDRNGNGKADSGEGLQGVRVELFEPTDLVNPVAWTTTNAEGAYAFGHVNVQATWVVRIDRATLPNGGTGLTNSIDPDGGADDQSTVSNISETGNLNLLQDFGYTATSPATIGGTVFDDVDADGELNADDEEGILLANVTIELRDANGNRVASTRTDSQGHYIFTGLPAGSYSVHVTDTRNLLEGWWHSLGDQAADADNESKSDPFTLEVTAGQANTNIDFGYYRQGAALGNRVWSDTNGDGIQDSDEEGLAGVTLQLVVTYPGGGSTTLKTLSGGDGGYVFGNLLLDESFNGAGAGQPSYSISSVASDGYTASPVEQGTDRQVDSNDPTGTTATVLKGQLNTAVTNDPGTEPTNAGYDFGYEPLIDLSLTKEVSPTTQTVGEEVTFTLTLSNAVGFSDATGVEVTDLLPSGYTFVSADPSADYASASGLWTVGNLAADDSTKLTITARVNASGEYENVAEVTSADQTDDDSKPDNSATKPSEDDTASAEPTINPQIDLSLTKTVSTMSPKVGDTVTFTLTLNNAAGYSNATGVSVQDVVPAGYGSISDISDSGSASGNTVTNTVTWSGLTVNANTNKSLTFKAVVLPSGPYANAAEITDADQDDKDSTPDNGTANEEDDTDSVTPVPTAQIDLSLTKSVAPASPKVGDTVTFTLTLSNAAGYADATGVSVQDALPAGYGNVSEISDSGSLSGSTLTWSGLSLATGSSKDLTFKAVVKSTRSYTNVAEVTAAAQPDKDSTPNNGPTTPAEDDRATLTPTIGEQIDLSLTKTVAPEDPKVGDTVTFTLTAANAAGFTNATGVAVTDQLPSGYRFVSADPAADYDGENGLWTIGNLDAGSSATLAIEARVLARGEYGNVAEVTAADQDDKDSTPGNKTGTPVEDEDDTARSEPTVTNSADLIVEKNGPVLVAAEGSITYTVTVSNAGPSAANDAVFADANPSGLTDMTWTCGNEVGGKDVGGPVCPAGSTDPANPVDGPIATVLSVFPAGSSMTFTITGIAPDGKTPADLPVTNTATVEPPEGVTDPDPGNNSDDVETGLGATPATADLAVLKYGPAQVETGGTLTYHIVVTNAGYAAADGAVFTDAVPAELTGVTWTCAAVGGSVCPDDVTREGNDIEETIATFPAGGSLIYTVTGTANASAGATIANTASIEAPAVVTDPDDTNNQSSADTSVVTGPLESADLALVKTGPATVAGGGTVTYQLVVSNGGAAGADDASVTDLVPSVLSDVTWTCGNATGGAVCPTLNGALAPGALNSGKGDVNLTIPTFPAGSSLTISVTGTAPVAGAFVNHAQVLPPVGVADPDPSNNPGGPVITQIPMVTLSGVVFNDCPTCGGTPGDGIQNGAEPGVDPVEPGSLNVVILDGEGLVLVVVPVAEDGSWQAIVPMGSGYQAFITTGTPAVGSEPDPVTASLPSGWVITGENDSHDNGILTAINANTSVTGLNFGIEASDNAIELLKTAFITGESGASCATAESPLVYVNKTQDEVDVTWCFTVTNQGNEALANPQITDAPLGIDQDDMTLSSGSLPLLPGASLVYTYLNEKRKTSLENSASISMTPVGGGDPVSAKDGEAIFAYVFDPPYGVKTGQVNGLNVIRWEMVWINNSPIDLNGVVIEDPIQAGMTYRPGTLSCDDRGSTTVVGTCGNANYDAVNRLIQVTANFGPDLGATDEASADNELVITFEVTIDNPTLPQTFENQATATWDPDGPGGDDPVEGVTDDNAPGGKDPSPINFQPPASIPTLSEWAMILLSLMLMGLAWRSRQSFLTRR